MAETVIFTTTGEDGDDLLIREYLFDAVERLPARPGCDKLGESAHCTRL